MAQNQAVENSGLGRVVLEFSGTRTGQDEYELFKVVLWSIGYVGLVTRKILFAGF